MVHRQSSESIVRISIRCVNCRKIVHWFKLETNYIFSISLVELAKWNFCPFCAEKNTVLIVEKWRP